MEISDEYHADSLDKPDLDELIVKLQQRIKDLQFPSPIVPRTDAYFLAKFIRTKDYKLDKALDSVQRYYANVYRNLNYIKDIRPSMFISAFHSNCILLLKHKHEGHRVAIARVNPWRPKEVSLKELQLSCVFIAEQYLTHPDINEKGIIVIFDAAGLKFEHVRKFTIREIRRITLTAQEGMPVRVFGVHFVNPPPLFWSAYQVATRFFTEKIRKRIQLHSNNESLHQWVDKSILPDCVGGDLTEEEACERHVVNDLIEKDIPYEEYWNGSIRNSRIGKALNYKPSTHG